MKQVTLVFLQRGTGASAEILLAMKKRGFGAGKWNGVGGKVEPGETVTQAAARECQEEIGVTPGNLQPAGYIQFFDQTDPGFEHRCHVFTATTWNGEPAESDEMRPQWFRITNIPYSQMWPDDAEWLPHVIKGELFEALITTSEDQVASSEIRLVRAINGGDLRAKTN